MDNDLNQPFFMVNTPTISRRRRIIEEEPTSRRAIERRYLDRGLGENREKQRGRQYLRDLMRVSTDVLTHDDYNIQMNEMVAQFGRVRDRLLRAGGLDLTLVVLLKYCYDILQEYYQLADYRFDIRYPARQTIVDILRVDSSEFNLDEIIVDEELRSGLDSASRTTRQSIVIFFSLVIFKKSVYRPDAQELEEEEMEFGRAAMNTNVNMVVAVVMVTDKDVAAAVIVLVVVVADMNTAMNVVIP